MANLTRFDSFRDLTAIEPWRNRQGRDTGHAQRRH